MSFAQATVGQGNNVSHGSDDALWVKFYERAVPNTVKTQEKGRPVHDRRIYVRIVTPGSRDEVDRPTRPDDKMRFPRQWEAFERQDEEVAEGTPLEAWTLVNVAQVADLKAAKIHTVDQLAALSDTQMQTLGLGGMELRNQAKAFLSRAADTAGESALVAELATRDQTIEALKGEIDELRALIEAKPKRGRPRKNPEAE